MLSRFKIFCSLALSNISFELFTFRINFYLFTYWNYIEQIPWNSWGWLRIFFSYMSHFFCHKNFSWFSYSWRGPFEIYFFFGKAFWDFFSWKMPCKSMQHYQVFIRFWKSRLQYTICFVLWLQYYTHWYTGITFYSTLQPSCLNHAGR